MIDNYVIVMLESLASAMKALNKDGMPDHRVRLNACREMGKLMKSIIPTLSPEERKRITDLLTEETRKEIDKLAAMRSDVDNYVTRK